MGMGIQSYMYEPEGYNQCKMKGSVNMTGHNAELLAVKPTIRANKKNVAIDPCIKWINQVPVE